jgi:outer membrane protein assembly factor BamB
MVNCPEYGELSGMMFRPSDVTVPALLAAFGLLLIARWIGTAGPLPVQVRVPGLDRPAGSDPTPATDAGPPVAGEPIQGDGVPAEIAGAWPWFRGLARDAISDDGVTLAREWPESGPPVLWSVAMGEGYAGAAVRDGRVFVLDYDEPSSADTMRCLSLDDGREIWRNGYAVQATRNHGISRTVPAVVQQCVVSLGPRCHVAGWDAQSGACRWLKDLVAQYGTEEPRWYAGQCPLIDDDRLILAPCGRAMLIAVDYETGDTIWESPNPRGWKMTHASIVPMDFDGQRMYLYCGTGGVAAVAANDGSLLWDSTEWPMHFATVPSPVVLPGGRVFLCSGYGSKTGALALQLHAGEDGQIAVDTAFRLSPRQFNCEQHTPVLFEGHLYGVRKRGGGQLVCLDLEGNEVWNSGSDRFGHGPYLIADGLVLVMDDDGVLVMAEATPRGYKRLGRHEVFPDGHDAWGPMALVAGRLIVRDMTRMVCLDVAHRAG